MNSLLDGFGVESPAYAAIRFLVYCGVTLLLGALCMRFVVIPRFVQLAGAGAARDAVKFDVAARDVEWLLDAIAHRLQRLIFWALVLLFVGTGLRLAAQYAAFFGPVAWSIASMNPLLLQTVWGHGWLLAIGSLGCATVGTLERLAAKRTGRILLIAGALAFVWSMAMSGHPAAADWPYMAMAVDSLHVLGAGGWIGTLFMLMVVAIPLALTRPSAPNTHENVARFVGIFSPIAMICVATVASTGVIAGWRELGGIGALFTSDYGVKLLWKLGLVAVVALIGAHNWRKITPTLGEAVGTRRMRRSAGAELVVACVVLIVTAVLVATSPP